MNDVKLAHPSLDRLTAFGQGRLGEAELVELSSHLGGCAECREKVEASGADTLIALLRAADTEHDPDEKKSGQEVATLAAPMPLSGPPCLPAELVQHGRYRVQELLGFGGMGAVYKAEHLLMERPVALKLISHSLTSNPAMVERFRREVKTAGQLKHANIVMAYDAEQAGDSHFLVMEYVEGKSLARVVSEQGPLPVREACDYIRQAALGLQHAHERGMVHRDIKPQNLMLTSDGQVKILDFGLARFAMESAPTGALLVAPVDERPVSSERKPAGESLTQIGTVMGTPDYIAPEQAQDAHTADIRADIYSLGCTLYDLLAGHAPFPDGTVVAKVMAHIERSPKPLSDLRTDVPPELVRVVERMMAKDPAQRFHTPAEVAETLQPFAAAARPKGRRPIRQLVAAALLGAAAMLLGGWIIYVQTDKGEFIIEASDKNIEALVNENGVTIRDAKSGREYVLRVGSKNVRTGEYEIVSELPDGVEIRGERFAVSRGDKVLVTARVWKKGGQPAASQDAKIAKASKAAEAYLKKLDAGDYGGLWEQIAGWARQHGGSKEDVIRTYEWLAQQSGKLESRTPAKPQYLTALPGAPDGEFVLFGYNSRFERFDPALEQLILMLEKDGQWRAVGYSRLAAGTPSVRPDTRAYVPAVVSPAQARFVIPVPDKKVWSWYLPNTPANQEEYRWTVKVANNGKSYGFGFSLYKRGGQKPASGTLGQLLNAGQVNLWSLTKAGGSVVEGDVRIRAKGNSVVVLIDDRKLLAQLFSTRPAVVEFESGLPSDQRVSTQIVAVTYEDTSAPAAQGPKPDHDSLQGTWKGVSGTGAGQKIPEEMIKQVTIKFVGDIMDVTQPGQHHKGAFTLDPSRTPKRITVVADKTENYIGMQGVYSVDGDTLRICMGKPEEGPINAFGSKVGLDITLRREGAKQRNPFGLPDVEDPDGGEVQAFAAKTKLPGGPDDPNAEQWVTKATKGDKNSLDGEWYGRWRNTGEKDWNYCQGAVQIKTIGDRVYIFYTDHQGRFLLETQREGSRLIGRERAIDKEEGWPCVFEIVSPERLDGDYGGQGRLDFRRKLEQTDREKIQGTWKGVSASVHGQQMPELIIKAIGPTITFADSKVTWKANPTPEAKDLLGSKLASFSLEGVFHVDPAKSPRTIDLTVLGSGAKTPLGTPAPRALLGIYKLEGDSLELCVAIDPDHPEERPTKFASVPGKFIAHILLKRQTVNAPAEKP
jgi:uncharacterized protein (TIGR03067 family)